MSDPTTVAEETARARAAEQALAARIAKLEPAPPPPPGPTFTVASSIVAATTPLVGTVPWIATVSGGTADHVDFLIDGLIHWPEKSAPWGGDLDTTTLPNGPHTFTVKAYDAAGGSATTTVQRDVANLVVVPAPPPVATSTAIASGWASTKDNWRIGLPLHGNLAMRFRKKGTGSITGFAWQQRFGSRYSAGDGGLYRYSLQVCKADGTPSGVLLAMGTTKFNISRQADAYFEPWLFTTPSPVIQDGELCCAVLENIHANPASNYISLNALFMWGDKVGSQRQPAFSDLDLALLSNTGSGWGVSNETPNFDILPSHEGFGYTQCNQEMWKPIGGSAMVREILVAPARTIRTLQVRVRRVSGTGALTLIYETQAGILVASGSVPYTAIAQSTPGGDTGGQVLATATMPGPVDAPAGAMALRLTAPAGTTYAMSPIRKAVRDNVKSAPPWGSYMSPGFAQYSSDAGKTWSSVYRSVDDQMSVQFAIS